MILKKTFCVLTCLIAIECSAFAKDRIQKGFERLAIYDYFGARDYFLKSVKRHPAPAYYGLSMIASRHDNPFFNIDTARVYILISDSSYCCLSAKDQAGMNKKYGITSRDIAVRKDSIAWIAWQMTKNNNDLEKWNDYINKYSYMPSLWDSAVAVRNAIAYSKSKNENTSDAYKDFLNKYRGAQESPEARRHYEETLFLEQTNEGTAASYSSFISIFPRSPYRRQAEDSLFTILTKHKQPEEYYAFAKKYTQNRNTTNSWMKLYHRYLEINGLNSFEQFLKDYPDFPYRKRVIDDYAIYNTLLLPVRKNNKWGFITGDGKPAINEEYDEVDNFSEGLCAVSKKGKYGYINKAGKAQTEFIYDEADPFENNYATVKLNGKSTLINRDGERLLDAKFEDVGTIKDDRILFLDKGKYGYTDAQGQIIIPAQSATANPSFGGFETASDFADGIAVAGINNRSGVIDRDGQWIIKPEFNFVGLEENGMVKVKSGEKFGLFNRFGEAILPVEYDAIGKFSDSLTLVAQAGKTGYADANGRIVIPMIYDFDNQTFFRNEFRNGYAEVKLKGKAGLIDNSGNKIIPSIYEELRFKNDTSPIAARKRGKWGYIDIENKVIIPFKFDDALEFSGDHARVKMKNNWGVINSDGKTVIAFQFDQIPELKNEVAVVKKGEAFGLIAFGNVQLVPLNYSKYQWIDENIIKFEEENKSASGETRSERFGYYDINKREWIWQENQ